MADQCIICLEDLDVVSDALFGALGHAAAAAVAGPSKTLITTTQPGKDPAPQHIALIKPCGHVLHDECLREWSQKANSCPICRHSFNVVEVLHKVGGNIISEYAVEDKIQVAEFDPNAWIEDNVEEEEATPCPICGTADQEEVLLLCDGCDAPYHTHCIGLERVPQGHWYCMECAEDGAYRRAIELTEISRPGQSYSGRSQPRTQASVRRTRRRARTDHWHGAWSQFSSRVHDAVGLDLDFSDDDHHMANYRVHQRRTIDERREYQRWQQRRNIANHQGAQNVWRESPVVPAAPVESAEERRSWGALEKAKELDASPSSRKRKSRSTTASPASPAAESSKEPERRLKRPRTRRVLDSAGSASTLSPVPAPVRPTNELPGRDGSPARPQIDTSGEPSFLSSLLREVEAAPSEDEGSKSALSPNMAGANGATSPSIEYSSPGASPSPPPSSHHTPRAMSITPPPHITKRPGSPLPLSSRVEPPRFLPTEYSPNRSPPQPEHKPESETFPVLELRQPRPRRQAQIPNPRSPDTSPARASMTIEEKEAVSKIVKAALAPHWKTAEITKEQYADINRDVSRKLYEIVASSTSPEKSPMAERDQNAWEKIAISEVSTAVKRMTA